MSEKCKKYIYRGMSESRCSRNAKRDGYCTQHHPDSKKAREEAAGRRWKEKQKRSPWNQLGAATKRIKKLEGEIAKLVEENNALKAEFFKAKEGL
jgi:hypothetical protein